MLRFCSKLPFICYLSSSSSFFHSSPFVMSPQETAGSEEAGIFSSEFPTPAIPRCISYPSHLMDFKMACSSTLACSPIIPLLLLQTLSAFLPLISPPICLEFNLKRFLTNCRETDCAWNGKINANPFFFCTAAWP